MINLDWETVYRASMYAFREASGDWYRFTLNGSPDVLPQQLADPIKEYGSLLIMTAWNPMSEERPLSVNEDANAELRNRLEKTTFHFEESYGCSLPEVTPSWREDSFIIYGMTRAEAIEWGESVGQRSLVWGEQEQVGLLFCPDKRFVSCGVMCPDAAASLE